MADIYSAKKRSEIMASIPSKHTKPELAIRALLRKHRVKYRLHVKHLPGSPDLVLTQYHAAIFVHGCFWHQHRNCKKATLPKQNRDFWKRKLDANKKRDRQNQRELKLNGWRVIVLWQCEQKAALPKLARLLAGGHALT